MKTEISKVNKQMKMQAVLELEGGSQYMLEKLEWFFISQAIQSSGKKVHLADKNVSKGCTDLQFCCGKAALEILSQLIVIICLPFEQGHSGTNMCGNVALQRLF